MVLVGSANPAKADSSPALAMRVTVAGLARRDDLHQDVRGLDDGEDDFGGARGEGEV